VPRASACPVLSIGDSSGNPRKDRSLLGAHMMLASCPHQVAIPMWRKNHSVTFIDLLVKAAATAAYILVRTSSRLANSRNLIYG